MRDRDPGEGIVHNREGRIRESEFGTRKGGQKVKKTGKLGLFGPVGTEASETEGTAAQNFRSGLSFEQGHQPSWAIVPASM